MIHYTSACLKCVGPKDIQGGETSCVSPEPSANSVPLKEVFISQTFKAYPQDILFTSMLKKQKTIKFPTASALIFVYCPVQLYHSTGLSGDTNMYDKGLLKPVIGCSSHMDIQRVITYNKVSDSPCNWG